MLKNFFNQPNAFVRSLAVLLFLGGLAFAGAYYANTSDSAPTAVSSDSAPTVVSDCCGGTEQGTTLGSAGAHEEAQPASGPCNGSCGHTDCRGSACQCGNTSWTCSCSTSCSRTVCNQAQYSCSSDSNGCSNSSCCSQASSS